MIFGTLTGRREPLLSLSGERVWVFSDMFVKVYSSGKKATEMHRREPSTAFDSFKSETKEQWGKTVHTSFCVLWFMVWDVV